jgi:hypothetical protein
MPNPLTDELSPEAKAWLAVKFAELARRFAPAPQPRRIRRPWWDNGRHL